MKKKQLHLFFNHFEQEHFGKDVFLVPYYLGKRLNCEVTIVYPLTKTNKSFPSVMYGVHLVPLKLIHGFPWWIRNIKNLFYLWKNAQKIDILMCFHHTPLTEFRVLLYKHFNPNGVAYVKLDMGKMEDFYSSKELNNPFRRKLTSNFLDKVDILSCETTGIYNLLKTTSNPKFQYGNKLVLMPNGFDEELLCSYNIKEKSFEEKENLMITVGRLGTSQKNTEMILRALSKVDMHDWTFYLIGSVEKDFEAVIETFYQENPDKRDSVVFTGPIYDKKQLWEYYNRAKVFVLTSRWEGSPIVFPEAKRFCNFIVSTEVWAYYDITDRGRLGFPIPQEDDVTLASVLAEITSGNRIINICGEYDVQQLSWLFMVKCLNL